MDSSKLKTNEILQSEQSDWVFLKIYYKDTSYLAKISVSDIEKVSKIKWFVLHNEHTSYLTGWCKGLKKRVPMHRYLFDFPKGMLVDHINGDGLDNRRENIRLVSPSQNCMNCRKPDKGIDMKDGRYRVRIQYNKKSVYLGAFKSIEEAREAYRQAAIKFHGEYTNLC